MEDSAYAPKKGSYDVVVIGAGVAGCCCARELARYELSCLVVEGGNDIACGATRANSAIVHGGYDPEPGSLKARYNVAGSKLYPTWAAELGFAFTNNESLVVGFDEQDREALEGLLERGKQNGVEGLSVISGNEARELEPCLSPEVTCALRVTTGGICDPYEVALASMENAIANGVELSLCSHVEKVECVGESVGSGFIVYLASGVCIPCQAVVNAAGVHSDEIHNQLCADKLEITPVRGEYLLFDPSIETRFSRTVFQVPTAKGKGVLVSPTIHGNLFVGPSATGQDDKDELATSADGLAGVLEGAKRTWPGASARGVITNFCGVRSKGANHDFVIGEAPDVPGFFDIACFESPGLTSAPAVGTDVAAQVAARLGVAQKASFDPHRDPRRRLVFMVEAEREAAVAEDGAWGHVVCRCSTVSEAELVHELHGPVPVIGLDALKWRTGATMGRCHGGFCTPEILRIMAREQGRAPEDVDKRLAGSWMVASSRPDYVELAQSERKAVAAGEGASARADAAVMDGEPAAEAGCLAPSASENPVGESACEEACGAPAAASDASGAASAASPEGATAGHYYDVVVIGGGAAGMAAAASARKAGAQGVLLVDREKTLGGIMRQCVHNGFGLKRFSEELSGPEFAAREAALLEGVDVWGGSSVLKLSPGVVTSDGSAPVSVLEVLRPQGAAVVSAGAVVLATGSRERGFGALNIAGERPSGIYTAGSAQALINLQGCLPGKRAVILGSGDIGLIMARRMTLEGMEVEGVYELLSFPSGLRRNIVQCLDDFGIPLHLSHTVVATHGRTRLESVDIAEVDPATRKPIPGTEVNVACDTLVLSCGLIPENELAREAGIELAPATGGAVVDERLATTAPGVFACGNALHVHDLADLAAAEGDVAGASAAAWALARVGRGSADRESLSAAANLAGAVRTARSEDASLAADSASVAHAVKDVDTSALDAHGATSLVGDRNSSTGACEQAHEKNGNGRATATSDDLAVPCAAATPYVDVVAGAGANAVVPQRVGAGATGKVSLTFRPRSVAHDVRFEAVAVSPDGVETVLKSRKARIAVPAEMERLEFDADLMGDAARIEVRMVEAAAADAAAQKGGE